MSSIEETARIWFFTDIHGSNACFRKFLKLPSHVAKPNVLIIGADITGKQIIPIIDLGKNLYNINIAGSDTKVRAKELDEWITRLSDVGYYPYVCSPNKHKSLMTSLDKQREVFDQLAKERLKEWMKLAEEQLPGQEICQVIINAGNDDAFFVDPILDKCSKIIRPEGKVVSLPAGLKLLSTGYSSMTPWKCPRDLSEDDLAKKISLMTDELNDGDKFIFNFHCPPFHTSLDEANAIDVKTLQPIPGKKISAGSKSVKQAIEVWKPLASLHGHIHEVHSKQVIGETLCFNPGTDYRSGKLQGVFLQINSEGKIQLNKLTEERHSVQKEELNIKDTKKALSNIPIFGKLFEDKVSEKRIDALEAKIDTLLEQTKNFNNGKL